MTMKRSNSIMLAVVGVVILIAAHGVVAWGGVTLSGKAGGWLPWIGGGTLAFGLYHVMQAFGLYHVIHHIRGNGHGHSRPFRGQASGRGDVERGPHDGSLVNLGHGFVEITIVETDVPPRFRIFLYDKHKQARSVPRNATVRIETVLPDDTRQMFDFHANGEYLESTTEVAQPYQFSAIVHVSHGSHSHPPHEVHFSDQDQAHHAHRTSRRAFGHAADPDVNA
jgi:hypothetical protein